MKQGIELLRLALIAAVMTTVALGASLAAPAPAAAQTLCIVIACPPPPPPADNTIVVRVDADPDSATDFSYSSAHQTVGSFSLDDDADATLPAARSFKVAAGTVKVSQSPPAGGYELRSIVCTDPSGDTTTSVAERSATFKVSGAEQVECTFKNAQPLTVRCPQGTVPNEQGECVINDGRVVCPSGTVKNEQGQCVISDGRVVCPVGTTKNTQGQCVVEGDHTTCPAGSTKNTQGECVVTDDRVQCPSGSTKNVHGQCVANETQCPSGSTKNTQGQCVVDEAQCPSGSTMNAQGQCVISDGRVVCPEGSAPNGQGQCVLDGSHTTCPSGSAKNTQGECVVTDDRVVCPSGSTKNTQGQCVVDEAQCPSGSTMNAQGQCVISDGRVVCPQGSAPNGQGQCVLDGSHTTCPSGSAKNEQDQCVVTDDRVVCPSGSTKNTQGQCVLDEAQCPAGSSRDGAGNCVADEAQCPAGSSRDGAGNCVADEAQCPAGSSRDGAGNCVADEAQCPAGSSRDGAGNCVVDQPHCPTGSSRDSQDRCVAGGAPPPASPAEPSEPQQSGGGAPQPPEGAQQRPPALDEPLPGSALLDVAGRISPPWAGLQVESGLFRNPLTGVEAPGGYGPVMIGHGLMRQGRRSGDAGMITAGVRAVSATVARSTGIEENPLHLLAIASAYNWARHALAGNADFEQARPAWERYLSTWKSAGVGPGAQTCFADPGCFHSYDVIDAVGVLELFATGLGPALPDAKLADRNARAHAVDVLGRQAYRAAGRSARALGHGGRLYRLGILSDQPANPLAYHALSIAALARGIELLGDDAPAEALIALKRTVDASSSLAGPDGDIAYLGRAHGAVWALGATVYASQVCARVLPRIARSTARRCQTLGARTLRRIVRDYAFGSAGVNAIPRFRTSQLDARGMDPYANVISSAGLSAVFLEWGAVEEARRGGPEGGPLAPLPLDRGGSFVDPSGARFAVLRKRSTWFAVHQLPTSLRDPRYDFGLLSLKTRRGRSWSDVLPPRPLPHSGSGSDSSGPVLIRSGRAYYPTGTRMSVSRSGGTVTVHGGWRTARGRWVREGVAFRFRALRRGVELSFPVRRGDQIAVSDFVPGHARVGRGTIRAASFASSLSPAGSRITRSSGWSSAYDASLTRVRRTVNARRDGVVRWTVTARPGR